MPDSFPLLHDWHRLEPLSSRTLARSVTSQLRKLELDDRTAGKSAPSTKQLVAIDEFDAGGSWPGGLRPFSALQLLGEAMTPTLTPWAFDLARRWSWYRYFWAFAAPTRTNQWLRLSEPAMCLVDHHRTLSSEQLSVALTLHVATWLVARRHPGEEVSWVDADVAMNRRSLDPGCSLRTTESPNRRMRPDYFFTATDRSGRVKIYAVEAKGTHAPSLWRTQMAKGARQVAAVGIRHRITVDGSTEERYVSPDGLVFSTTLNDRRIVLRAVDPAGDETWEGSARSRERDRETPVVRFDPASAYTVVEDPEAFRHGVLRAADASLLALAGQYATVAEVLPEDDEYQEGLRRAGNVPLERVETPVGDVLFHEASLPLGDSLLVVQTGAAADVLEALRQGDRQAVTLNEWRSVSDSLLLAQLRMSARPKSGLLATLAVHT